MPDHFANDNPAKDDLAAAAAGGRRARKPYATPHLMSYGDIREITQTTTASTSNNDGQMDGFVNKRTNGGA